MSAPATTPGAMLARRVFETRGNHSEAHLTEPELAALFDVAVEESVKIGRRAGVGDAQELARAATALVLQIRERDRDGKVITEFDMEPVVSAISAARGES